jgi:hypothetical protein
VTKLNQIIAIEKGVRATSKTTIDSAHHQAQKPDLFAGLTKTYEPKEEDGVQYPPDSKKLVQRAPNLVTQIQGAFERLWDLTLTKDTTNCSAGADIVVGDTVLATDVPVTTLIWLEKQLVDLTTIISKLPVTSVEENWTWDRDNQLWRAEAVQTLSQKKIAEYITVAPATEKHPAQVVQVQKDVPQGTWTAQKLSGALSPDARDRFLVQVDLVVQAVKKAREQANMAEVIDVHMGGSILNFIFG